VTLRAELSHAAYNQTAPQKLLLKVDFATAAAASQARPPLNLALVLDRSGSMAENKKFAYTIEAAREVIQNLTDRDIVSLVAYNERALVLSPAGRAVNKPFLLHRLEEIAPEGYTDLSAGLLEGIAQVNSQSADGQIKQVLLLTDGLANRGVTNPTGLQRIVEKARAKGVGLSTLGCGTEFNEKLLTGMAAAGGGRYTYIKSPEQIPTAFKEELRGLAEVVAQNARLEVSVAGGQINKVFGQMLDRLETSHQFPLGNLRAGERGVFLLALKPGDFKPGGMVEFTAKLTFDDPQAGERTARAASGRAAFAAGGNANELKENQEVVLYGAIMEALEWAIEGAEGFDEERYVKARAAFDQWHERARQYALNTRNQDLLNQAFLLKHFLQEVEAARAQGKVHGHAEARQRLAKEADYQRYLLFHHREPR